MTTVVGTGRHRIRELVEAQSRRRAAATGGESTIPLDDQTARTVIHTFNARSRDHSAFT